MSGPTVATCNSFSPSGNLASSSRMGIIRPISHYNLKPYSISSELQLSSKQVSTRQLSKVTIIEYSTPRISELKKILIEDGEWNSVAEESAKIADWFVQVLSRLPSPEISVTGDAGYYLKWEFSRKVFIAVIYPDLAKTAILNSDLSTVWEKRGIPAEVLLGFAKEIQASA